MLKELQLHRVLFSKVNYDRDLFLSRKDNSII